MSDELAEVIAERELERGDGVDVPVVVRIGRPYEHPEGDWACAFQITGVGDDTIREAFGVDSVQALALCFQMIRADLGVLQRRHRLTWLGMDDLGI